MNDSLLIHLRSTICVCMVWPMIDICMKYTDGIFAFVWNTSQRYAATTNCSNPAKLTRSKRNEFSFTLYRVTFYSLNGCIRARIRINSHEFRVARACSISFTYSHRVKSTHRPSSVNVISRSIIVQYLFFLQFIHGILEQAHTHTQRNSTREKKTNPFWISTEINYFIKSKMIEQWTVKTKLYCIHLMRNQNWHLKQWQPHREVIAANTSTIQSQCFHQINLKNKYITKYVQRPMHLCTPHTY